MFYSEEEFEKIVEKIKVKVDPNPEYRDALRQKMLEAFDEQGNVSRKTSFSFQMPFFRLAGKYAAGFIILAVLAGLAVFFFQERTNSGNAFARIIQPILTARTVTYKTKGTITGPFLNTPITTADMFKEPGKYRSNSPAGISILDFEKQTILNLIPALKTAMIMKLSNLPPENQSRLQANMFFNVREELEKAKTKRDIKLVFLGKRKFNGIDVIGYRCKDLAHFQEMTVWANAQSLLPVKIESTVTLLKGMKITTVMTDFKFNVPLDDSLFSMDVPPGYRLQTIQFNASMSTEADLLEMFRRWANATGGKFPSALDLSSLPEYTKALHPSLTSKIDLSETNALNDKFQKLTKETDELRKIISGLRKQQMDILQRQMKEYKQPNPDRKVIDDLQAKSKLLEKELSPYKTRERSMMEAQQILLKKMMEVSKRDKQNIDKIIKQNKLDVFSPSESFKEIIPISRGLLFINLLPKESDWHYAGQKAKYGDSKTPIFWYRPQGSKSYRVIYADLKVEEKEIPPKRSEGR
jgi:outer membrane lipoprotein-sorting protein